MLLYWLNTNLVATKVITPSALMQSNSKSDHEDHHSDGDQDSDGSLEILDYSQTDSGNAGENLSQHGNQPSQFGNPLSTSFGGQFNSLVPNQVGHQFGSQTNHEDEDEGEEDEEMEEDVEEEGDLEVSDDYDEGEQPRNHSEHDEGYSDEEQDNSQGDEEQSNVNSNSEQDDYSDDYSHQQGDRRGSTSGKTVPNDYVAYAAASLPQNNNNEQLEELRAQIEQLNAVLAEQRSLLVDAQVDTERTRSSLDAMTVRLSSSEEALRRARNESSQQASASARKLADQRAEFESLKLDFEGKKSAYKVLSERYTEQEKSLAKIREDALTLERESTVLKLAAQQASHGERRANQELELLKDEYIEALEASATVQAELQTQQQLLDEVRESARQEAYTELNRKISDSEVKRRKYAVPGAPREPNSVSDDSRLGQTVWRQRFLAVQEKLDTAESSLSDFKELVKRYSREKFELHQKIENLSSKVQKFKSERLEQNLRVADAERDVKAQQIVRMQLEQDLSDMRRRVMYLLMQKQLGKQQLSPTEKRQLDDAMEYTRKSDRQHLMESLELNGYDRLKAEYARQGQDAITEKGLAFRDVSTLVYQNQALVSACRNLARLLSPKDSRSAEELSDFTQGSVDDIKKAGNALLKMQKRASELRTKLEEIMGRLAQSETSLEASQKSEKELKVEVEKLQSSILDLRKQLADKITISQNDLQGDAIVEYKKREAQLQAQIQRLEGSIASKDSNTRHLQAEQQQLYNQYAGAQLRLGKAEQETKDLRLRISELNNQVGDTKQTIGMLNAKISVFQSHETELLQRSSAQDKEIRMYSEKCAQLERAAAQNNIGSLIESEKHQKELEEEISEYEQKVGDLLEEKKDQQLQLTQVTNEKSSLQSQLANITQGRNTLQSHLADITQEKSVLLTQLNDEKSKRTDLENKLTSLLPRIEQAETARHELQESMNTQLAAAEKRNEELVDTINDTEDQLTDARNKYSEASSEQTETQNKLMESKREIDELNKQLEDYRSQLQAAQDQMKQICADMATKAQTEPKSANIEPSEPEEEVLSSMPLDDIRKLISTHFPHALSQFESKLGESLKQDVPPPQPAQPDPALAEQAKELKNLTLQKKLWSTKISNLQSTNEKLSSDNKALQEEIDRLKNGNESGGDSGVKRPNPFAIPESLFPKVFKDNSATSNGNSSTGEDSKAEPKEE